MKISECMSQEIRIAAPDHSMQSAAQLMADLDAGFLPVADNERLIGVVTDRDIAIRGVAAGRPPEASIREVMSDDIKYIASPIRRWRTCSSIWGTFRSAACPWSIATSASSALSRSAIWPATAMQAPPAKRSARLRGRAANIPRRCSRPLEARSRQFPPLSRRWRPKRSGCPMMRQIVAAPLAVTV